MTDMTLEQAIAEVKRANPEAVDPLLNTILAAIASGDLIPASDARLTVAVAYQRTADAAVAYCHARTAEGRQLKSPAVFTTHSGQDMRDRIIALADTDALAEVQALQRGTVEIGRMLLKEAKVSLDRLARAEAAEAEVARLREALTPFAFYDEECNDVQHAWEIRYQDRFKDWIDFADIEHARAALAQTQPTDREGNT